MPLKRPFKTRIYEMLNNINKELSRLESQKSSANADMKVISIKELCLSEHKKDIEELISLCMDRNRF